MKLTKKFSILLLVISFTLTPIDFNNIFSRSQKAQAFEEITEDTIWTEDNERLGSLASKLKCRGPSLLQRELRLIVKITTRVDNFRKFFVVK